MKSIDEEVKEIMNMDYIKKLTKEEKQKMGKEIKNRAYDELLIKEGSLDALIMSIEPSSESPNSEFPESSNSSKGIYDLYQLNRISIEHKSYSEGIETKGSSHDNHMESDNKNDDNHMEIDNKNDDNHMEIDNKNDDNIVNDILNKIKSFYDEEERIQFCKQLLENLGFK